MFSLLRNAILAVATFFVGIQVQAIAIVLELQLMIRELKIILMRLFAPGMVL